MNMDKPMTLNSAAEHVLGWTGRFRGKKLLRKILAKEKKHGRELAIRSRSKNGKTAYFVTERMLNSEFPELLVPTLENVVRELRIRIELISSDMEKMVNEAVDKHMDSCRLQNRQTMINVATLKTQTDNAIRDINAKLSDILRSQGKRTGQMS